MASSLSAARAPFRVGTNHHYIPSFTVALLRSKAPANFAKFHVPLWFSKLDLRDYLFHAYNVRIINVRSYVKQSPVKQGSGRYAKPQPRRWFRPKANKYMTVELERPFVWPEEPDDFSPWNKDESAAAEKEQNERIKWMDNDTLFNEKRKTALRQQAQDLLDGKTSWMPSQSTSSGSSHGSR